LPQLGLIQPSAQAQLEPPPEEPQACMKTQEMIARKATNIDFNLDWFCMMDITVQNRCFSQNTKNYFLFLVNLA
jgi:hypothetical protein